MSSPQILEAVETPRVARRRRAGAKPSRKKVALHPGVVLFDPKEFETSNVTALTVEMLEDNQEDDQEEEDSQDNQEELQDNEDEDEDPDSPAAKQARLRVCVIDEICETEKSYVSDISTLLDHYIVALEDSKHRIMEDAQIAVFFNNLRHLVMLNSKLLTDLTEIKERRVSMMLQKKPSGETTISSKRKKSVNSSVAVTVQCEADGVGAVFCRYAPLFKLYGGYAKDYEEVAALLQNFGRDTRLGFTKFLEACRERSGSSKQFESLLIMPIQRIPRYKLLLERLCELTAPEHPDAAFLTEAVDRVRAAASLINETVRRQENLETVLQAQQKFSGQLSLFTADRRLIKSGKLMKMSTKRQEDVMIHLFNDILLYSGVLLTGGYRVRRIVHLHSKAVGVKAELPAALQAIFDQQSRSRVRKDCGFVVTSREKTFILFTETPEVQREWVDAIAGAVKVAQNKKKTELVDAADGDENNPESCEGPADAAALWVPDEIVESCAICKASFRAYYRRRHHCRRCGAVVCDTCSLGRAPLFVGESSRAERVCSPCFKILDRVRQIAMHWLSRVVEFRGVLRRRRYNKWSEHYYELRAGVLKQFTVETASSNTTPVDQNGNAPGFSSSGHGGAGAVGGTVSGAGTTSRCCTDELTLAGAIVIHRSDSRAHKNRFCFQISTTEYDESDVKANTGNNGANQHKGSPLSRRLSQTSTRPHIMKKLSPLKQAVTRFGDVVSRRREPAIPIGLSTLSTEGTGSVSSPPPLLLASDQSLTSSLVSSSASGVASVHESEWILCASSIQEEVAWRVAIQSSADKALHRMRRSRVTDFPGSLAQSGILSLSMSVPANNIRASMSVVSNSSFIGNNERRRMSSLDRGRTTDDLSVELAQAAGDDRDAYLLERRRRQILKEIIRSEESYVQCLGECIRLFVQPLLLRQLEGRQMFRRRQNKRRGSLRPVLGTASPSNRRMGNNGNAVISRAVGSSATLHGMISGAAAAANSATTSPAPNMLVMDADLSIFFSSVDQICTLNQQLLDHLSRHLEETSPTPLPSQGQNTQRDTKSAEFPGVKVHRAGAIFHAYAPLMQLYTSYASRHSSALNALDSPEFAGFLRELPAEADENSLRRYLNMPVERIPRYKMLLQELLGSTPPDHVDFSPLQAAIQSVNRVASKIEAISERRENARTLAAVSAKVGIDLTGRHFIRDGMLRKVCRSKVQTYYFVLLEDAMVYGRQGGLHKKFRMIDLWECKVAEDTEAMPGVITTVVNSNNAFCFYSPLKSFILLTDSETDKIGWTTDIRDCIDRNLQGKTHPRRTSVRSEVMADNDEDSSSGYELESGFVIKNGWLNVSGGAVANGSGASGSNVILSPSNSTSVGKKPRRMWITLTLQTISLGATFKAVQPGETIPIELCEVAPLQHDKCFRLQFLHDTKMRAQTTYVFEALSLAERDEWVRALKHCISGGDELDLRRRSLKAATLAPIFMFDKVSNVCTICTHSFAVYRPRHHCRYGSGGEATCLLSFAFDTLGCRLALPSLTRLLLRKLTVWSLWLVVWTDCAARSSVAIARNGGGRCRTARARRRREYAIAALRPP